MSRRQDRDQLIATLARELPDVQPFAIVDLARKLCRAGTTLQRLAEAQCNGDWPADNGERKVETCGRCESSWVRSTMSRRKVKADTAGVTTIGEGKKAFFYLCQDCRTQDRVTALLAEHGMVPRFDGDPRGPVLRVFRPGVSRQDIDSGRERGIFVS